MTGIKPTTLNAAVFISCLLFSGCVLYPKDENPQGGPQKNEGPGSFPQELSTALFSSGTPSFDAPSGIVGLDLDSGYSDYSGVDNIFVLSYTGASRKNFDDYASYLAGKLGDYYDASGNAGYSCYGWFPEGANIELGFPTGWIRGTDTVPLIPAYTLYLLIKIH
jgi:hypothetical protein